MNAITNLNYYAHKSTLSKLEFTVLLWNLQQTMSYALLRKYISQSQEKQSEKNTTIFSSIIVFQKFFQIVCTHLQNKNISPQNFLFCQKTNAEELVLEDDISNLTGKLLPNDFPLVLHCQGNLSVLQKLRIGIVGSRHPSFYGRKLAENFANYLSDHCFSILSGGALGVDGIVNSSALNRDTGASIAVLGSSLHAFYPASNTSMFQKIKHAHNGLIVSQFSSLSPTRQWHFPMRNHVLAALCDFLVVIEAKHTSGSIITAKAAIEYGVDVGAVPGNIDSALSEGCNWLIQSGAFSLCHPRDVVERMISFQKFCNYQSLKPIPAPMLSPLELMT